MYDNTILNYFVQFWWSEEWTFDSITRSGWEVHNRSIHEDESVEVWVGSLINCCKPNWDVITSALGPSWAALSCLYQFDYLTIKSPRATIKYGLLLVILSKFSSQLLAKSSKVSGHWVGEQYSYIKLHILPPNNTSKFMHSSSEYLIIWK